MAPSINVRQITVVTEPLTQSAFRSFGDVVEASLPHNIDACPSHPPTSPISFRFANQDTALKASPITPLKDDYYQCPNGTPSKPTMSMFVCFPRTLDRDRFGRSNIFKIRILERHPYTTQTFIPMGLAPGDPDTKYLVIVAPTLPPTPSFPYRGPPDLQNLRAFVAHGRQAVTYGAGTWHAPMAVIGAKRIDFVVYQSMNGVSEDDCQEVEVDGELAVCLDQATSPHAAKL